MKKLFLSLFTLSAILVQSQEKDYSLAKSGYRVGEIYIFIGCIPVAEYSVIEEWKSYWQKGNGIEACVDEAITRARKKYSNVDGIIFKGKSCEEAQYIKFVGKEPTGGGFKGGDKVVHKDGRRLEYGEVVIIDNTKKRATIKYLDEYGDEKTNDILFEKLSHISNDDYQKNIEKQNEEIVKHKFTNGEKVTWADNGKPRYGEVLSLNPAKHDVKINYLDKFGDTKTETLDFLKVEKADETKYKEFKSQEAIEIEKHKFTTGETVSFVDEKATKVGEVTALNGSSHKASVKYLTIYGDEKTSDIPYFDLEKISKDKFKEENEKYQKEIAKYKFKAGDKVNWNKKSAFKSEIVSCEVVSLDDLGHKAVVKFSDKEGKEKQEKADYLDLTKIN
ncbi:MAG: hypothetical protein KA163_06550 [Bacteroidia bacterium]|nr:hypothetical protein [Bacteroidia bacterium]